MIQILPHHVTTVMYFLLPHRLTNTMKATDTATVMDFIAADTATVMDFILPCRPTDTALSSKRDGNLSISRYTEKVMNPDTIDSVIPWALH